MSSKMILNATALWNSLDFAQSVGLRAANPYFEYYATLSLLRGVVFMLPTSQEGDLEALISISHSRAINMAFDWLAHIDQDAATRLKKTTLRLKAQRELIAYKVPASGDKNLSSNYDLLELLILLGELAQLTSELLEASIDKNADPSSFKVLDDHIHAIASVDIEGFSFLDDDDYRRLGYVQRKTQRPYNLANFMHAGLVEDFFDAWDGDEERGEFSNGAPSNWTAIFEVP